MCFSLNNFFENSYLQQYNSTNNNNKKLTKNYFTTQEISNILAMNNKNDLSIFHLNTRSLAKKKENIEEFVNLINCKPEIIAISETKINSNSTVNFSIPQYFFLHVDSKTNAGGVALYIKENIRFKVRNDLNVQVDKCENLWIEIEQKPHFKKLIVGVIYRHPTYDFKTFENKLIDLLISFEDKKCEYVIIGDININLMMSDSNPKICHYIRSLESVGCNMHINTPTRFAENKNPSILDHIYSNSNNICNSGICLYDISDHLPIFLVKKNFNQSTNSENAAYVRCMKSFEPLNFVEDLDNNLQDVRLKTSLSNTKVDDNIVEFVTTFQSVLNKHAPFIKLSRKKKNYHKNPRLVKAYLSQ